ncbi:uncharacterized protein LOC129234191 [Uloborus diversus]|uniref:uncharacterized protein LOC129234191 n=1 Tax=Uloborus diversus TaxID=327109 RepID=UPI00240A7D9E|nr:uncharacterized protein LOC129234191 [Uloborus diversus]
MVKVLPTENMIRSYFDSSPRRCGLLLRGLLCICLAEIVSSKSVAVFGRGSAGHGEVTEQWGVLSQGTQIFLLVLGGILGLFSLYGLYRLYRWCKQNPRKPGH